MHWWQRMTSKVILYGCASWAAQWTTQWPVWHRTNLERLILLEPSKGVWTLVQRDLLRTLIIRIILPAVFWLTSSSRNLFHNLESTFSVNRLKAVMLPSSSL